MYCGYVHVCSGDVFLLFVYTSSWLQECTTSISFFPRKVYLCVLLLEVLCVVLVSFDCSVRQVRAMVGSLYKSKHGMVGVEIHVMIWYVAYTCVPGGMLHISVFALVAIIGFL